MRPTRPHAAAGGFSDRPGFRGGHFRLFLGWRRRPSRAAGRLSPWCSCLLASSFGGDEKCDRKCAGKNGKGQPSADQHPCDEGDAGQQQQGHRQPDHLAAAKDEMARRVGEGHHRHRRRRRRRRVGRRHADLAAARRALDDLADPPAADAQQALAERTEEADRHGGGPPWPASAPRRCCWN